MFFTEGCRIILPYILQLLSHILQATARCDVVGSWQKKSPLRDAEAIKWVSLLLSHTLQVTVRVTSHVGVVAHNYWDRPARTGVCVRAWSSAVGWLRCRIAYSALSYWIVYICIYRERSCSWMISFLHFTRLQVLLHIMRVCVVGQATCSEKVVLKRKNFPQGKIKGKNGYRAL